MSASKPAAELKPPAADVFLQLPRCVACASVRLKIYKTIQQGDGSRLQYAKCLACQQRLRLVWE